MNTISDVERARATIYNIFASLPAEIDAGQYYDNVRIASQMLRDAIAKETSEDALRIIRRVLADIQDTGD